MNWAIVKSAFLRLIAFRSQRCSNEAQSQNEHRQSSDQQREFAFDKTLIEDILKEKGDCLAIPVEPDARRALGLHLLFKDDDIRRRAGLEWMSSTVAYYNSYYWFLVLGKLDEERHGFDAGLRQQCFQMLELMPADVDWAVVEELAKAANPKFLK